MFGSEFRPRRPVLLLLVYGAFLALVGITASAGAAMVSTRVETATLNALVGSDAATVRTFANSVLRDADLAGDADAARIAQLEGLLATLVRPGEIVRAEILLADGTVLAGDRPDSGRRGFQPTAATARAFGGTPSTAIVATAEAETPPAGLATPSLLQTYLPLVTADGTVPAVVAVWRDAAPVLAELDQARRDVVVTILSAALVAAVLLFLIFRAAQSRISRQTDELVQAARRDALTGTLNHGSLVGLLADRVEHARRDGASVGVALLDLDNFRLLNDHHGHRAGDEALLAVADLVTANVPTDVVVGRYGPDEFLVIVGAHQIADLEPSVERIRTALVDLSLQFEATERLPVTLSVGIATYPAHGASVTSLLSTLALTLDAAKASGGDEVRVADADADEPDHASFDVLQGLVFAVDTKDRYTKRHSEDVARYAIFLARRLGLDEATVGAIRTAGLLHDVGKIGIPDGILRKPGRLTAAEREIIEQHVALGDLIVRDLPDLDLVRAGVRHHHERWDGRGYLHRLAGEEIPLIARILAVGDAFSAMTTSRPYRKALGVEEALRRLGDAAGTQLDEGLVRAFIDGLESAPDAPLPGVRQAVPLWVPAAVERVA